MEGVYITHESTPRALSRPAPVLICPFPLRRTRACAPLACAKASSSPLSTSQLKPRYALSARVLVFSKATFELESQASDVGMAVVCVEGGGSVGSPSGARTPRRARPHPISHPYARPATPGSSNPHRRALSLSLGLNVNFATPGSADACLSAPAKLSLPCSFSENSSSTPSPCTSNSGFSFSNSAGPSTPTSALSLAPWACVPERMSSLSSAASSGRSPSPLSKPLECEASASSFSPYSPSPLSAALPPPPSGTPFVNPADPALAPYLSPLPSFSVLTPHLLLGDLAFAEDADSLEREGVTHVVSVVGGRVHVPAHIPPSNQLFVPLADAPFAELVGALRPVVDWVRAALVEGGVLPPSADDDSGLDDESPDVDAHVSHRPVRILVHCAHGISRSPAVGAALLVALPLVDATEAQETSTLPEPDLKSPSPRGFPRRSRTTLSAQAALAYVAERRPPADVNWGFRAQLGEWETLCRAGAAVA